MQPIKMLYLAALPNSGSTLVALLANSHPDVVSPGELMGPGGKYHGEEGPQCACGEVLASCAFWTEIGLRMQERGHWWQPDYWGLIHDRGNRPTPQWRRLVFGRPGPRLVRDRISEKVPGLCRIVNDLKIRNRDMAQSVLEVSGKSCLLDTSNPPQRMARLARTPGIDLRVIHMIRDPRGWCNSRRKKVGTSIGVLARRWRMRNRYIKRLTSVVGFQKRLILSYEDLCRQPQRAMYSVYGLGDLARSPFPEDISTIKAHLLGNRMRTRGDSRIREDIAWQEELT